MCAWAWLADSCDRHAPRTGPRPVPLALAPEQCSSSTDTTSIAQRKPFFVHRHLEALRAGSPALFRGTSSPCYMHRSNFGGQRSVILFGNLPGSSSDRNSQAPIWGSGPAVSLSADLAHDPSLRSAAQLKDQGRVYARASNGRSQCSQQSSAASKRNPCTHTPVRPPLIHCSEILG